MCICSGICSNGREGIAGIEKARLRKSAVATVNAISFISSSLGQTIEEMWASSHLTRRCKLLMLAVVAHGLGCQVCAFEVNEALQREGMHEPTLTQVLTHLDAPDLDVLERLLVRFARDTIWFEPAALQRRPRGLRDYLSGPQLLEAIGVASLANGLCRLGAMVMGHS